MRKYIFLTLMFLLVATVSAQTCPSDGYMGTFSSGANIIITQTCPTCNFITISTIKEPITSNIVLSNQNMSLVNGSFIFTLNSSSVNNLGTYFVEGFSNLDEPFIGCFIITPSGFEFDNVWMNFLIIFFLAGASFTCIYQFNESRQTIMSQDGNFIYYYLGAFMLLALGTYTLIFGFGGFETVITVALGYILWGCGLFFMTKPYFIGGKFQW